MNPEAQRIAIAEACGFKWWPSLFNKEQKILALTEEDSHQVSLGQWVWEMTPDYLNDLNAMHEAENFLTEAQRYTFYRILGNDISFHRLVSVNVRTQPCLVISAKAFQRAEAFLRTLNLWTEQK